MRHLLACEMKRARTSLLINNDCVCYVIVVKIFASWCKRVQLDCVFNKYVLNMYVFKARNMLMFPLVKVSSFQDVISMCPYHP